MSVLRREKVSIMSNYASHRVDWCSLQFQKNYLKNQNIVVVLENGEPSVIFEPRATVIISGWLTGHYKGVVLWFKEASKRHKPENIIVFRNKKTNVLSYKLGEEAIKSKIFNDKLYEIEFEYFN